MGQVASIFTKPSFDKFLWTLPASNFIQIGQKNAENGEMFIMSHGNACPSLFPFTWNSCYLGNFLYRDPELQFINTVTRFNVLILGHGRTDVISIQGILFLFNKERLKWTQAETSLKYAVKNFWPTRCSVKHVPTRPIQSATELPANVHTSTPNMNKMHLQHWRRNIRTKTWRCMLMAGQPVHIRPQPRAG
jgi:hypothetical protein